MELRADLHLHSNYSDGAFAPELVLKKVAERRLSVVSLTDHDTMYGVDEAIETGKTLGIEVIPGVELSATISDQEIHILGYFVDQHDREFQEYLSFFRAQRLKRAARIVQKLNALQVPIKLDSIIERAGKASLGRPHIAHMLVEEGYADSYYEAFDQFIGNGRPAYERKYHLSPRDAIELIARAGGFAFLAHPGNHISETLLIQLIKLGLDGIEVIHPSHTPEMVKYYRGIVSEYFLLESGGSDFHGGLRDDDNALGRYTVTEQCVEDMKRRLFDLHR
ncbi:MAG: PHP domain-containing protein [Bacteroidota bacterium]